MKMSDIAVKFLLSDIESKDILEVACGCAEFSVSAASYANSVMCIDIDDSRLPVCLPEKVHFDSMDASNMSYPNNSFDTIVIYNAFYHIYSQWERIEKECMRLLKPSGKLYIISSWKLDTSLMDDTFTDKVERHNSFSYIALNK